MELLIEKEDYNYIADYCQGEENWEKSFYNGILARDVCGSQMITTGYEEMNVKCCKRVLPFLEKTYSCMAQKDYLQLNYKKCKEILG